MKLLFTLALAAITFSVCAQPGGFNLNMVEDGYQDAANAVIDNHYPDYYPPEYRWYALELEQDDDYWLYVNTQRIIVGYETGLNPTYNNNIQALLSRHGVGLVVDQSLQPEALNYYMYEFEGADKQAVLAFVREAQHTPGVLYAEPEALRYNHACPANDTYYLSGYSWHTSWVDLENAWCVTMGDISETMAVIDGYLDYLHTDINPNFWYGYNYVNGTTNIGPSFATDQHGTHVTGIMAARINNANGVVGAVNNPIFFANAGIAGSTSISLTAVSNALLDIAANGPGIRVVNMSLGSPSPSTTEQNACITAYNAGKLLIASSGNDGNPAIGYPAGYSSVVCVTAASLDATASFLTLTSYSNHGAEAELVAPGGDGTWPIFSTVPYESYGGLSGTSMSSPVVAGVAGLVFAANRSLSSGQVRTILQQTAIDDDTNFGWDVYYGYGLVCASCAVTLAQSTTGVGVPQFAETSLQLFPNPANDVVSINMGNIAAGQYRIFDTGGKLCKSGQLEQAKQQINLTDLAAGFYNFEFISTDGERLTEKLVVQ